MYNLFDLLTSPLITLGIPLIIVVLLKNKKDCKIKESIIYIIKLSILWGISYATIFFAKWVISSIILQRNVIEVALKNIIFRVNGNDQYPAPRLGAILENLKYLYNTVLAILLIIITVIWGIIMVKNKKETKENKSSYSTYIHNFISIYMVFHFCRTLYDTFLLHI